MNKVICYALALMWAQGALASAWHTGYAQGLALLHHAGIGDAWAPWLVWGGIVADAVMAAAAFCCVRYEAWRRRYAWANVALIATYTLLATVIAPQLWLDPFGALAKNIPILLWLWCTIYQSKERSIWTT